ncbi:unnamed protein product [Amoebophrya sp. A120]|nr:unnamed protein product [Amoebophrya sp. A120]|eukprot:GSA120T00005488001.1
MLGAMFSYFRMGDTPRSVCSSARLPLDSATEPDTTRLPLPSEFDGYFTPRSAGREDPLMPLSYSPGVVFMEDVDEDPFGFANDAKDEVIAFRQDRAARTIQRGARDKQGRTKADVEWRMGQRRKAEALRQDKAARTIQKANRDKQKRIADREEQARADYAFRLCKSQDMQKDHAARTIQRAQREKVANQQQQVRYGKAEERRRNTAARTIQRQERSKQAAFQAERDAREESVRLMAEKRAREREEERRRKEAEEEKKKRGRFGGMFGGKKQSSKQPVAEGEVMDLKVEVQVHALGEADEKRSRKMPVKKTRPTHLSLSQEKILEALAKGIERRRQSVNERRDIKVQEAKEKFLILLERRKRRKRRTGEEMPLVSRTKPTYLFNVELKVLEMMRAQIEEGKRQRQERIDNLVREACDKFKAGLIRAKERKKAKSMTGRMGKALSMRFSRGKSSTATRRRRSCCCCCCGAPAEPPPDPNPLQPDGTPEMEDIARIDDAPTTAGDDVDVAATDKGELVIDVGAGVDQEQGQADNPNEPPPAAESGAENLETAPPPDQDENLEETLAVTDLPAG